MNIAIVDDLPEEIENFKSILEEYSNTVTAIFLDIYMGGMTGIEAAEQIRKVDGDTLIVFLTSSNEHMGSAFSIHAFDYIEKPASKEKIFHVMDDILKRHTRIYEKTLDFVCERKNFSIPLSSIVSIRTAESNYLEITDREKKVYNTRMTFSGIQKELEGESAFLLINRGVLVNMDYIARFAEGECFMKNGRSFQVYTKRGFETEQKWQNYIFSKVRDRQRDQRKAKFMEENRSEDSNV